MAGFLVLGGGCHVGRTNFGRGFDYTDRLAASRVDFRGGFVGLRLNPAFFGGRAIATGASEASTIYIRSETQLFAFPSNEPHAQYTWSQ
jgi:hypothetical protein